MSLPGIIELMQSQHNWAVMTSVTLSRNVTCWVSRWCHGECYRAGNLSVTGVSEAACHELAREAGAGRSGAAGCESPAQPSRTIDSWELALRAEGPGQ